MVATYKNISVGDDFMRELARIVVSICQIVSGGVLCFLSSYNAMESRNSTLVSQKFSIDLQAKKVESYMFNFIYYGVACCWPAHYYLFSLIAWPPISGWIWIPYSFGKMMTGYTYTILAFYTNSRLAHLVRLTGLAIHHWKIWNL